MIGFQLVTLDGVSFNNKIHEVIVPTPSGLIAVFEHHAPVVSIVSPGVISIRHQANDPDSKLEYIATAGGVVEILEDENVVRVLVDEADREDEINEQEAQAAFARAQEVRAKASDRVSIEHAQSLVDRQASRLKVAELRRHRKRH